MSPERGKAWDARDTRAAIAALRYESQVAGINEVGKYVEWLEVEVVKARRAAEERE